MKPLYIFWGKVKRGKQRGKHLGYPTANISLHNKIPEGIYVSEIRISNVIHIAATFIGSSKTFNENTYQAECYILDFKNNIYNQWITITLYKKLRENIKFGSEKALVNQIKQDVLCTRNFFDKNS
jgi:riboflavin kinase / FMN adenylyltransferase